MKVCTGFSKCGPSEVGEILAHLWMSEEEEHAIIITQTYHNWALIIAVLEG